MLMESGWLTTHPPPPTTTSVTLEVEAGMGEVRAVAMEGGRGVVMAAVTVMATEEGEGAAEAGHPVPDQILF